MSIILNGKQIRDLAIFAGLIISENVGDDDELLAEYSIIDGMKGVTDEDGGEIKRYEYIAILTDYPEEGCYPLGDEATP